MIEMKIVFLATHNTLSFVSFPDFQFDRCRNKASMVNRLFTDCRTPYIIHHLKFEFEYIPIITQLLPRVDQSKQTIEDPNTRMNLFVNLHKFRLALIPFRSNCSLIEKTILSQCTTRICHWLVNSLRIRTSSLSRNIMALIYQNSTIILNPICIGRACPDAHQNYTEFTMQTEVHSSLKVNTFFSAHIEI